MIESLMGRHEFVLERSKYFAQLSRPFIGRAYHDISQHRLGIHIALSFLSINTEIKSISNTEGKS